MDNCIFCKIANGDISSEKIYEDDKTLAFLDIAPVNPGHTLLIPKRHSRNILDTNNETLAALAKTLKKISRAVKKGAGADGINIHINNEPAAGQVVFHLHIHIIPRYTDDALKLWHGDEDKYDKSLALQIKNAL